MSEDLRTIALERALHLVLSTLNQHIGTTGTLYEMTPEEMISLVKQGADDTVREQILATLVVKSYGMMHNIARRIQQGGVFNPLKEIQILEESYPQLQKTYLEICHKNQVLLNPSKD